MNIGLYNLKYGARKLMKWVLPFCEKIDPNWISLSLLPFGALAAWAYGTGHFLWGVLFILARMFLGTLDGLVAEHFQRETPCGKLLNRLAPELCDAMLFALLAFRDPIWGIPALCFAWLTTFSGLIGLCQGQGIQSVGPAGQTDRLAALILCSIFPFDIDWMRVFLIWCTVGGAATVVNRLTRTIV